jgi:iron complex outermembrane recepter protein
VPKVSGHLSAVTLGVLRALSVCAPALASAAATSAQPSPAGKLARNIPAQSLTAALTAFADQTGLQLIYITTIADAQLSKGAPAGLSVPEALAQLLDGTGLRFEFLNARTVRIFAASPVPAVPPATPEARASASLALEGITVTANRREEKMQDVPIAIEVLTGETLARLNVITLDDFVRYLPAVTAQGEGPAQNNIYVRGLGTAVTGVQGAGVVSSFPNVAVYLDEQSLQLPHRNLDIYAADLERIEVLEGPQGTLFGAGAQAGVVRYITNKPKLDAIETTVTGGYAATAHGDPGSNLEAAINLPVITDKLAVRAVVYGQRRGGYIDNIPASFARAATDPAMLYSFGGHVPADSVTATNLNLTGTSINPVDYKGLRAAFLYRFNEDWDALLTQSYQSIEADGVFAEMAANSLAEPQPALSVQQFNPSYDKDRFENTALTIAGHVGALKLLYAGSYLARNIEQVADYTSYSRATYAGYYQCVRLPQSGAQCFTPSSTWQDIERNTDQSHELRLSTPADRPVRAIGGLFYQDYRIQEQWDGLYRTAVAYFQPLAPPTGYYTVNGSRFLPDKRPVNWSTPGAVFVPLIATAVNPGSRPLSDGYFSDITRGYTQRATFASIDLDLIPQLTLTLGTRYYRINSTEVGSSVSSGGCSLLGYPQAPSPCVNRSSSNLNANNLERDFSGFTSRVNLSWKITESALLYYTWSQGFRAGSFNRVPFAGYSSPFSPFGAPWQQQATLHGGWAPPLAFAPDDLTNNELGWKTQWLDQRIQWDGAVYQEDWSHVQIGLFSNGVLSYNATINGGDYRVRGIETTAAARVTSGLTIEGSGNWNHSELVRQAPFAWADGTPVDFDTLQTASGQKVTNPGGALGSPLAGAPPFKGNIRARYELTWSRYDAFVQIGAVHQSHSSASTDQLTLDLQGQHIDYNLPAFTTYDAAFGVGRDPWLVQVHAENLSDTRAQTYANYAQFYKSVTVVRPRTIALYVTYRLDGNRY